MRTGFLVAGVALLVIGIITFIGGSQIASYSTISKGITFLGITIGGSITNTIQMQEGEMISYIGVFLALVGLILAVYGSAAQSEISKITKIPTKPPIYKKSKSSKTSPGVKTSIYIAILIIVAIFVAVFIYSVIAGPNGTIFSMPFIQNTMNFNLQIQNSGSLSPVCTHYTFPKTGSVDLNWATTNGGTVTFSVIDYTGTELYSSDAASGTSIFSVYAGQTYSLCAYDWLPETVNIQGTETFS